jgi:hypothetical protein
MLAPTRTPPSEGSDQPVANDSNGIVGDLRETADLVKRYAEQETIAPLRGLGRYIGFGVGGALLVTLGVFLLAMSGLRAMQDETTVFDGFWSWAPYVIVAVPVLAVIGLAAAAIAREPHRSR